MITKAILATVCCLLMVFEKNVKVTTAQTRDADQVDYIYTEINSPGSPLSISRVEILNEGRGRRGVNNSTTKWSHKIPYVLDPSYTVYGESVVYILKRAIQRIMEHVCVTYVDVTDTWNRSNTHWFTQNGYENNAYILIKETGGCASTTGYGNGIGGKTTSPCKDLTINTHEMFHTLGGAHPQQNPGRDNYITINHEDITPSLLFTYDKFSSNQFVDVAFDPMSALMYHDMTWTRNGLETYTAIRDDIFVEGIYTNSDEVVFYELSQVYRCNELFCNNSQVDCGLGYHTIIKGKCRCVCPSELDPEVNCKSLINKASSSVQWPNTPMVVIAGGEDNKCPEGFDQEPGWLSFDGIWPILQRPVPVLMKTHGKTIYIPLCTKSTPHNISDVDWESWPTGGRLCMIKPTGVDCRGDFEESTVFYQSMAPVQHNGSIGDTTVQGYNTTMKLCCRNNQPNLLAVDLPNKDPFRLIYKGSCPRINGMREYQALVDLYTKTANVSGPLPPRYAIFTDELQFYECYYLPPVYGCNQEVKLTRNSRSMTVTTPGFGQAREPNRRCLYSFQVPQKAQVRITFNKYDLYELDYFLVKRFHKWLEYSRFNNEDWPEQFVSEGDYLSIQYWSSWQKATNHGVNFTAEVLLPEESCFNITTKGEDYFGNTTVTETYEDCLPWAQTVDCFSFPQTGMNPIWLLLSGNACRNPGGELIQPWCYVYKNGSNCHKRYCDVCNTKSPFDVLKNCTILKRSNPEFCSQAVERYGCFKTCGFLQDLSQRSTCGPPNIPSNGISIDPIKSSYNEGEKVIVQCKYSRYAAAQNEMVCTQFGWTHLESACKGCPEHWIQYGDRCFNISSNKLTMKDAEKFCNGQGPNGTLFQIRDSRDQQMLRDYKKEYAGMYTNADWISGEYRSHPGKWYFTNTDKEMTYFNWSDKYISKISGSEYDCIRLIAENLKDNGGWHPFNCSSSSAGFSYICQISSQDDPCGDRLSTSTCEQLLTVYPRFCSESRFGDLAIDNCRKSCGRCQIHPGHLGYENATCRASTSSTLSTVTHSSALTTGQVITFTCNPGFFLHSGNLERACSSSGQFLGPAPVCRAEAVGQDVKLSIVRRRNTGIPNNVAVLMTNEGYRVPLAGKIARWYYFCQSAGLVSFLVYRPSHPSSNFSYIGVNNVTCEPGRARTFFVPPESQLMVQKDDVVGAYSTFSDTIAINNCTTYTDQISKVLEVTADSLTHLKTLHIFEERCVTASIGYHILPN